MRRSSKSRAPRFGAALACLVALAFCATTLWGGRAEAGHLFEFYVDGYGGGMYGFPAVASSTNTADDFFHSQSGGLLGGRVGIELLFVDLYVQFDQFFSGSGAAGSTVQAMLGWDGSIGCGGPGCWAGVLGIYGGGIFGFPYTPSFPVDQQQISTYGVGAEVQLGAEYNISRFFVFQAMGTVGYHYLFNGSAGIDVSNSGAVTFDATHGIEILGKVGLRFHVYAL